MCPSAGYKMLQILQGFYAPEACTTGVQHGTWTHEALPADPDPKGASKLPFVGMLWLVISTVLGLQHFSHLFTIFFCEKWRDSIRLEDAQPCRAEARGAFRFAELFAGIGGFRLALERLGGETQHDLGVGGSWGGWCLRRWISMD